VLICVKALIVLACSAEAARGPALMPDSTFLQQMAGYGLTTAQIHYYLPDQPSLLQLFVWQKYDLAPRFPELRAFLDFWSREIEGKLHSVTVAHASLIRPAEFRNASELVTLH
jgi:uncharacterized protein Usg